MSRWRIRRRMKPQALGKLTVVSSQCLRDRSARYIESRLQNLVQEQASSGIELADVFSAAKRSQIMPQVKSLGTKPKTMVAAMLKQAKVHHRRNVASLPGKPDFVVQSQRLAILVHGCYWHSHRGWPTSTDSSHKSRLLGPQARRQSSKRSAGERRSPRRGMADSIPPSNLCN